MKNLKVKTCLAVLMLVGCGEVKTLDCDTAEDCALGQACIAETHTCVTPTELTIEIHRSFPYVDGDTHDDARFVAVQDGDGSFSPVSGTNGVYRVPITSDRYGIAVACADGNGTGTVEIVQQTIADGTTYRIACEVSHQTEDLAVTVTNLAAGQTLHLASYLGREDIVANGTTSLWVLSGMVELYGTLTDSDGQVARIFRILGASSGVTIDAAVDGAVPEHHALTGTSGGDSFSVGIHRLHGSVQWQNASLASSQEYVMLPPALRQADDLYQVRVSDESRAHTRMVAVGGPLEFELPTLLAASPATLVTTPFVHTVHSFSATPPVLPLQEYRIYSQQSSSAIYRVWQATLSSGWIAEAPLVTYEFPDLSAIPGFADVALLDGHQIDTSITRTERTSLVPVDGGEMTTSGSASTVGEDAATDHGARRDRDLRAASLRSRDPRPRSSRPD